MTARWSFAGKSDYCGTDGVLIPEGALMWKRFGLKRCEAHAPSAYDPAALERKPEAPVRNLRQEVIPPNPALRDELHTILRKGGWILGRKRPKPFRDVADDPKVVRAGGDQ